MQAVILAAGKGTRLAPLSWTRSKAMSPVAGKPMVTRVLDTLRVHGIDDVVVVSAPDDVALRAVVDSWRADGLRVRIVEQRERLGMAHALSLAAPLLRATFVLSACDNLVPAAHVGELLTAHQARQAAATLSLLPVTLEQVSRTGVVVWEEPWVRRIVEKPRPEEAPSTISSLPLYVLEPEVLALLPEVKPSARGEYELQDALQLLMDRGARVTGVFTASRRQVTTASDLLDLNLQVLAEEQPALRPDVPGVTWVAPMLVEAGAVIGPGCRIGPRVYVEAGAIIGADAVIADAVILRGAVIETGSVVRGQLVVSTWPAADAV